MQLDGARGVFLWRRSGLVVERENFRAEKRPFVIDPHQFETPPAFGDQIEFAVGILFHDGHDFGRASHIGETLLQGTHHAEDPILSQAFANHFFVAWFEDVQGQGSAGEQDDIEREQRDEGVHGVSGGEHLTSQVRKNKSALWNLREKLWW